jgi:hypothetical protein
MAHICPIEGTKINEPTVRIVALFIAITSMLGAWFQSPVIFFFLAFDFYVRGFGKKQWSLFRYMAIHTVTILDVKEKLIDAGGKKFAAKIGFTLSVLLTLSSILQWSIAVYTLGSILVLCATLESVLAFCVGCEIYSLYKKLAYFATNTEREMKFSHYSLLPNSKNQNL